MPVTGFERLRWTWLSWRLRLAETRRTCVLCGEALPAAPIHRSHCSGECALASALQTSTWFV